MVNPELKKILNDERLIGIRDRWFLKLQSLFDGEPGDYVFAMNGIRALPDTQFYKDPERWVDEALTILAENALQLEDPVVFRPLCLECGPYGVHFIDKIFGAEVLFNNDSKQWYNEYLPSPVGLLQYPDLDKDDTWDIAKRVANAFVNQGVSLPTFGHPTIASTLNIAVNLYGENILVEMSLNPENAKKDLQVISRLLCNIHRWYRKNIPLKQLVGPVSWLRALPPGYGQFCGCTTQLISDKMYREFIAPLDEELLSVYPNGGMIHLCGSHTQHIPVWREMKSLKAVQLNDRAAIDLEQYYKELREDQIIYLEPCKEMSVEKAVEITGGRRLVIEGNIEKPIAVK